MAMLIQLIDGVAVSKFDLNKSLLSIGRHPDNHVFIDDSSVSGRHAQLLVKGNEHFPEFKEFYIEDLGSTNGTFVNDLAVTGCHRLHNNDVVRLAWNNFKFVDDSEPDLEKTLHMLK